MNSQTKSNRLLSLDIFRGLTVFLMILVNSPGNDSVYSWLEHSPWNGCTLADLVFPFFLFIVGVSVVFAFRKTLENKVSIAVYLPKIFKRTFYIFFIGLLLNFYSAHFSWENLRYFGVLQRIAICYFFSALFFLGSSLRTQILVVSTILLTYWVIFIVFPGPNSADNPAAWVDRLLFSAQHLYGKIYDPEGFLSTFPSLATTLLGNCVGYLLISPKSQKLKFQGLLILGLLLSLFGWIWSLSFPFNKALWTSSYVLWTAGLSCLTFSFLYWSIEIKSWTRWAACFFLLGTNAMLVYVLHVFFLKLQYRINVSNGSSVINLKTHITNLLFNWAAPTNASFLYALSYTFFWILVLFSLHHFKKMLLNRGTTPLTS